jgi:hypothetical protein
MCQILEVLRNMRECPRTPAKEAVDKRVWKRDYATEGRDNASRQVAESTPLLDKKQWLDLSLVGRDRRAESTNGRARGGGH